MKFMTYQQGKGFVEADVSDLPEWRDDEDFEAWLGRGGFEKYASRIVGSGDDCAMALRVYYPATNAAHGWHALVSLNDVGRCDEILVATAADYLALLATLAPVVTASAVVELEQLRGIAEKAFRAWHGHRPEGVCYVCDPEEARRIEEARRRRRERRATGNVNQERTR